MNQLEVFARVTAGGRAIRVEIEAPRGTALLPPLRHALDATGFSLQRTDLGATSDQSFLVATLEAPRSRNMTPARVAQLVAILHLHLSGSDAQAQAAA